MGFCPKAKFKIYMRKHSISVSLALLLTISLCFAQTTKEQKDPAPASLCPNPIKGQAEPARVLWPAVVTKPVANIYRYPSVEADVVSQAIYTTNVDCWGEKGGWACVSTPDSYRGWMPTTSLRPIDRPYAEKGREGQVAQVETLFANLYCKPDVTKNEPIHTIPYESRLEVIKYPERNKPMWIKVRLPEGRTAWIQSGDVAFDIKPKDVNEIIAWSKQFLGLPYLWGGTSTFGYDCSGFTQMLFRRRGVYIPRDAKDQAHWVGFVHIERRELKAGDLVFFSSRGDEKEINHTGMYIGNDEFINATPHQRPVVQISSLKECHWTKLFVAARRLKDSRN